MRFSALGFTNDNHALIQPILVHCGAGTSATDRSILSRRRLARADVEVVEAKPEPGQLYAFSQPGKWLLDQVVAQCCGDESGDQIESKMSELPRGIPAKQLLSDVQTVR